MIDINTLIQQALEKAVNEAVHSRFDAFDSVFNRIHEELSRVRKEILVLGERLEEVDRTSASVLAHNDLEFEVAKLKKHSNTLDHAIAKNDEQFDKDVHSAVCEYLESDDGSDKLASAIALAFEQGDVTLSVSKV